MSVSLMSQKSVRNETVAAVQAKAKALKEQQRSRLDSRHYYMFEIVADRLQIESTVVEEFVLDGDQVTLNYCLCCPCAIQTNAVVKLI